MHDVGKNAKSVLMEQYETMCGQHCTSIDTTFELPTLGEIPVIGTQQKTIVRPMGVPRRTFLTRFLAFFSIS